MKFTNKVLDELISLKHNGWRLERWSSKVFFRKHFTKIFLHPNLNEKTYSLAIKEIENIERTKGDNGI